MKQWLTLWLTLVTLVPVTAAPAVAPGTAVKKAYVLPIREDIMPPLVYLVRRGVKEAMEAKADVLIIDMETNGGRVDVTEEIIAIINKFPGRTVTYVNKKAFSAGAFISFATEKIYMAPQSVIGAASAVLISPTGTGPMAVDESYRAKLDSGISALVRANAEKFGHNPQVADAMVKKTRELVIDGKTINKEGEILTLTNGEAEREYGTPAKSLLSAGTVGSIEDLLKQLKLEAAKVVRVEPSGAEQLATWVNAISPLLLIIGIAGVYVEFKTPGFGLPGIIGISAFTIYFLGGYVAGLTGLEWVAVFLIGLVLVALELFFFQGTIYLGLAGFGLMLTAIVMGMVDLYPGMPTLPTLPQLQLPLNDLLIALFGSVVAIAILSRWLPQTSIYHVLVSTGVSGEQSVAQVTDHQRRLLGQTGVTKSVLRPGGKAQFGDELLDVVAQGEIIPAGAAVRIVGTSGPDAVVALMES